MNRFSQAAAILLPLLLAACDSGFNSVSEMSCDDVENELIDTPGGTLVKIVNASQTSRTENELVCHGTAIASDNSHTPVRYRAYVDEDREIMVSMDSDEHDADEAAEAEATAKREQKKFEADLENGYAEAQQEAERQVQAMGIDQ